MWRVFLLSAHGGARELISEKNKYVYIYYELFYSSSIKYTWIQYRKRQIKAPGTTFSSFGEEVAMEGDHGSCCRFATLTEVDQGASALQMMG